MLKGITITLIHRTQTGSDPFGAPIYAETREQIEDVLVAPASSTDLLGSIDLTSKKAVYVMAIPKGDTHDWTDCVVEFWDKRWRSAGIPLEGIEAMIPLRWNKRVVVELYE